MPSPIRRDARRYRRRILTIGGIVFALVFVVGAPIYVDHVQADLDSRVPTELAAAGYEGVTATFDGQDGVLTCAAPLSDPEAAREAAYDVWGVRSVELDRSCRVNAADDATSTTDVAGTTSTSATTTVDTGADDTGATTTVATTTVATTTPSTEPSFATVADAIAGSPQLSLFSVLLQEAGLDTDLGDPTADPVTVFASTDDAFGALPADSLAELRSDPERLRTLLLHQMTAGTLLSSDFVSGPITMLDDTSVALDATAPSIAGVPISVADIVAGTGVVHIIDDVIVPDDFDLSAAPELSPVAAAYDGTAITLSGAVATEAVRAVLVAAATADGIGLADELSVDPDTGLAAPEGERLAGLIVILRTDLLNGTAGFDGADLSLTGTYLDDASRDAAQASAAELGVDADLAAPSPATEQEAVDLEGELNAYVAEHPVLFEPSSARITDESQPILDQIARLAARFDGISITVQGHTDSDGDPNENLRLSEARAFAVMQALIERGIPSESLGYEGFGNEQPILGPDGVEDKAASRRVEFEVVASS